MSIVPKYNCLREYGTSVCAAKVCVEKHVVLVLVAELPDTAPTDLLHVPEMNDRN